MWLPFPGLLCLTCRALSLRRPTRPRQARTNPVPGKLPDAFTTVGAMGFAALPPSQWTKSMADAAKAFAVSAAAATVPPGARAG